MTSKPNQALKIEYVAIDTLRIDPGNPRRMDDAQMDALTGGIRKFGMVQPIVVQRADRTVIGGNQRIVAARRLGFNAVPVVFVDLNAEQARVLSLGLNRIGGSWDEEMLGRLLAEFEPVTDLTLTGFDSDEIGKFLRMLEVREKRDRPEAFDVEAALASARSAARVQRGEIWTVGEDRIMCGDATDAGDVAQLLGETRPAMAFTDPPYNVALGDHGGQLRGSRKRRIQNDAMPPKQWSTFIAGWAGNLVRSVDGAIYCCMSTKEWASVSDALADAGGHWSDAIIWSKDRFVLGRADYQRQYEPIWFGWREGAKHHWCGDRDQGDVWEIDRPSESEAHPTMKPLALVEKAITNSSKLGDVVLDLFLGSGTTLIAAERTGRVCFGMEIDPHYCSVAIARLEAFTGSEATRITPPMEAQ